MSTEIVTSFSLAGAALYGRRCVDTTLGHWPYPLVAYTDVPMTFRDVRTRLTGDIPDWRWTQDRLPAQRGNAEKPTNYIWDAKRFAVKAFVWHDAAEWLEQGTLVWLDADTVTRAMVPTSLVPDLLGDADMAFLGRGAMHPETGCVVFRIPEALPVIKWCRDAYRLGWFKALSDGWTDCHVLRAAISALPVKARDLTSHAHAGEWTSRVDAFALSPLGPYVDHLKGTRRKQEAAA